jgi:hypothetical protein
MLQDKVGELKLFKLFGHFSLLFVLGFTTLNAQSFENFKRVQSNLFEKYKDKRDNVFNSYLSQNWKAYHKLEEHVLYEKEKPKEISSAKIQKSKAVGPRFIIKVEKSTYTKPKMLFKKKDIEFNFYGSKLGFNISSGIEKANFYPQNQKGIINFFNSAAFSKYENLVDNIKKVSKEMNLNDWGVYLLVLKISNSVHTNPDNSKLLSWFLFNKLGYAVKIGLVKTHVVLMHYSEKIIYSTPNYSFDDKKYYVIENYAKSSVKRIFSYPQNYPDATKPLDLSLREIPNLVSDMKSKTLTFDQFEKSYSISFDYNKNLMNFMATYPQADYETFFNAPLDSRTYESIANSLKEYVDGKKASEAINFVLNFVQKAFKYERDAQQFGREKVMFAQETLCFDKSDCEDRAVLFSYLIKKLFGIGVIGVKYKDHMTTALAVPMEGDKVKVGSKKFVLADPTYIDSTIGMSMSKYKSIKPQSYITVGKI